MPQNDENTSVEGPESCASSEGQAIPGPFQASFDIARVPTQPGCYLMRNEQGRILYVGKAKNLRARVRAYINENDARHTVKFLMRRVADIDFLVTSNEKEALLLENSLIKKHRPRYNFRLKDDKTYVSIRVNLGHEFPRLTVGRKVKRDRSKYFGPYSSAAAVRQTLKQIQRVFPLRTCSDAVLRNRTRPCLYHQMGQCPGPCVGLIEQEAYREIVEQVVLVLEGRNAELERRLRTQISALAEHLEFEKAAKLRDRLQALHTTLEPQRTARVGDAADRDVFGVHMQGRFSEIQVLYYRSGKLTGGRSFSFNQRETPMEEVVGSFLLQYYSEASSIPPEVLLPFQLEDAPVLAEVLAEERGASVTVSCPQRGDKRSMVDLANRNARSNFEEKRLGERAQQDLTEEVRKSLKLISPPTRIECFDISSTQGTLAVGSMVTFDNGSAAKSRYRRFSIKQVAGQDDFGMLREVLLRRFRRAVAEDDLPDLVLIDGGKGQLNVARAVFQDLGIEGLSVVGIAKARNLDQGGRSPERFFLPGRKNPVVLPQNGPVVLYLARIRDEAHRFAVSYHRRRRAKALKAGPLTQIPGIGPKRARVLLTTLGSLKRIQAASQKEIAALPGFNEHLAEVVKRYLDAVSIGVEEAQGISNSSG